MKKNIIIIACFAVIALVLLFALGFRITYSPALTNSWGAVEATGVWLSGISTVMLTVIIIRQTNKNHNDEQILEEKLAADSKQAQAALAEKELKSADINRRIDLFEYRYKIYSMVRSITSDTNRRRLLNNYKTMFDDDGTFNMKYRGVFIFVLLPDISSFVENDKFLSFEMTDAEYVRVSAGAVFQVAEELNKAEFFFSDDILAEIKAWMKPWETLITRLTTPNYGSVLPNMQKIDIKDFENYLSACDAFAEKGTLDNMKAIIEIPWSISD
jgi:hypothetical protein